MKNPTNIIFYWAFHCVYWNNLTPLFISSSMCFLVDTVQSNPLIFCFTNAERMCWKESQAEGNPYLAVDWICFLPLCVSELTLLYVPAVPAQHLSGRWFAKPSRAGAAESWKVCEHGLRCGGFQEKQSWEMDLACASAALLPPGEQLRAQVCGKEAVLGLQGRDTLIPVLQRGGDTGTNCRSWLNCPDESLVNQGLEKTISLTSVDFCGSQTAKHLLIWKSWCREGAVLPLLRLGTLLPLQEWKYVPPSTARGKGWAEAWQQGGWASPPRGATLAGGCWTDPTWWWERPEERSWRIPQGWAKSQPPSKKKGATNPEDTESNACESLEWYTDKSCRYLSRSGAVNICFVKGEMGFSDMCLAAG